MAAKIVEVERERELVAWLRRKHREEVLRLTALVAGDERRVYPQERSGLLPRALIQMSTRPRPEDLGSSMASTMSIETVLVEAVPMALPLPDGRSVGWFAWRIVELGPTRGCPSGPLGAP